MSILTFLQCRTFRGHLSGCHLLKVNSVTRICQAVRVRSLNLEQVLIRDRQFIADMRTEQLRLNSRHKQGNFSTQCYPHCSSGPPVFLPGWYGLLFILELSRSKRKATIALDCLGLEFTYVYLHIYISVCEDDCPLFRSFHNASTVHILRSFLTCNVWATIRHLSHNTTFELLENGADRAVSSEMWCPIDR